MGLLLFGIISYVGVIVWMAGGAGSHVRAGSGKILSKENVFPLLLFGGILLLYFWNHFNGKYNLDRPNLNL